MSKPDEMGYWLKAYEIMSLVNFNQSKTRVELRHMYEQFRRFQTIHVPEVIEMSWMTWM